MRAVGAGERGRDRPGAQRRWASSTSPGPTWPRCRCCCARSARWCRPPRLSARYLRLPRTPRSQTQRGLVSGFGGSGAPRYCATRIAQTLRRDARPDMPGRGRTFLVAGPVHTGPPHHSPGQRVENRVEMTPDSGARPAVAYVIRVDHRLDDVTVRVNDREVVAGRAHDSLEHPRMTDTSRAGLNAGNRRFVTGRRACEAASGLGPRCVGAASPARSGATRRPER